MRYAVIRADVGTRHRPCASDHRMSPRGNRTRRQPATKLSGPKRTRRSQVCRLSAGGCLCDQSYAASCISDPTLGFRQGMTSAVGARLTSAPSSSGASSSSRIWPTARSRRRRRYSTGAQARWARGRFGLQACGSLGAVRHASAHMAANCACRPRPALLARLSDTPAEVDEEMGCGDWMYTSFLSGHEGFIQSPQANSNVPQSTESAADRKRQNGHGPPQPHRHINEGTKNQTTGYEESCCGCVRNNADQPLSAHDHCHVAWRSHACALRATSHAAWCIVLTCCVTPHVVRAATCAALQATAPRAARRSCRECAHAPRTRTHPLTTHTHLRTRAHPLTYPRAQWTRTHPLTTHTH
jgi:hypothetical protein